MDVVAELHRARDAYERRDWLRAYRALTDLDDTRLAAEDLLALATSAELLGRHDDAVQAMQRAHQAALAADDPVVAARAAVRLGTVLVLAGETAVAGGWLARGERLIEQIGGDVVERGYLLVGRFLERVRTGDLDGARPLAPLISACGRRHGDANLIAHGLNLEGRILTVFDQVPEGLRLLDEAMVGVVSGEVDTLTAGEVYCSMIEACQWVGDLGRAAQWTHALAQWCDEQPAIVAFTGPCALHRAQLMRLRGSLRDAVTELERAVERYEATGGHPAVALAHEERGDILRLLGDLDGADAAYAEAMLRGASAQPGRALLAVARGDVEPALAAVRHLLEETHGAIFRHRVIPGCVEVLLAAGEVDAAVVLARELADTAEEFGCSAVRAASAAVTARVSLARGEPGGALPLARLALRHWAGLDAAHEVARSRTLLALALRLLGDEAGAVIELRSAATTFTRIGARPDADEVAGLLGTSEAPGGLSPREVEVLRLVAAGWSNAEIAAQLHISGRTVARHLSNIFTKIDVGSRTAAAAFAHEHRLR